MSHALPVSYSVHIQHSADRIDFTVKDAGSDAEDRQVIAAALRIIADRLDDLGLEPRFQNTGASV